jgi:hypothetical protein
MKRGQTLSHQITLLSKRVLTSLRGRRVLAWFLITYGLASLLLDYLTSQALNQPAAVLAVIGFGLLASAYRIFDVSDSVERLRAAQQLVQRGIESSALHVHPQSKREVLQAEHRHRIWIVAALLGILIVASPFLLLGGSFTALLAVVAAAIGVSVVAVIRAQDKPLRFSLAVLAATGLILLAITLVRVETIEATAIACISVLYLVAVLYGIARTPQSLPVRRLLVVVLMLVIPTFIVAFAATSVLLYSSGVVVAAVASVGMLLAMALLAWQGYGRDSYAKYFLIGATVVILLFLYQIISSPALVLTWLIIAMPALALGVLLPSYSARMVALAALALAVIHYILGVLGGEAIIVPYAIMAPSFWVGLVLSGCLGLVSWWYQEVSVLKGRERRMQKLLTQLCRAVSATILLSAILASADPFIRLVGTTFWTVLMAWWAQRRKSQNALIAALFGGMVLIITLLVVDLSAATIELRTVMYVLASMGMVTLLGILTYNHFTRNTIHS